MAAAERRRQLQSHFRESDEPPQTPENRATKTWRRALRHEPDSPLEALALRGRNDGSEVMEDFFGRRRRVRRPAEAKKEPPTRKAPSTEFRWGSRNPHTLRLAPGASCAERR